MVLEHSSIPFQYPLCFLDFVVVLIQKYPSQGHVFECSVPHLVMLFGEVAETVGSRIQLEEVMEAEHGKVNPGHFLAYYLLPFCCDMNNCPQPHISIFTMFHSNTFAK